MGTHQERPHPSHALAQGQPKPPAPAPPAPPAPQQDGSPLNHTGAAPATGCARARCTGCTWPVRELFAAGACSSSALGCAAHLTQCWLIADSHAARAAVARTAVAAQSSSSAGASAEMADAVAKLAKITRALGKLQHQRRLLPYEALGVGPAGRNSTFWTAQMPASASRRTQQLVRPPRSSLNCHCDPCPSTFDRPTAPFFPGALLPDRPSSAV